MFDSFLGNFIIEYIWVIIFKSLVLPLFIYIAVWVLPVEHLVDGSRTGVEDITLDIATTLFTPSRCSSFYLASRSAWAFYSTLSIWIDKKNTKMSLSVNMESYLNELKVTSNEVKILKLSTRPLRFLSRCHRQRPLKFLYMSSTHPLDEKRTLMVNSLNIYYAFKSSMADTLFLSLKIIY